MTLFEPIEGFEWCGGCGAPTRPLTEEEMADVIAQAAGLLADGAAPAAVFHELQWLTEMQVRSRIRTCECPPPLPPAWWAEAPSAGFHLYRLWTPEGRLLYVGVSTVLRSRLKTHARRLGALVDSVTWEEHPDAASMLLAESEAIRVEDPALNKAKVDPG